MSELWALGQSEGYGACVDDMGQQLSWLEHTTDNREVDGSSPFWPTTTCFSLYFGIWIWISKYR